MTFTLQSAFRYSSGNLNEVLALFLNKRPRQIQFNFKLACNCLYKILYLVITPFFGEETYCNSISNINFLFYTHQSKKINHDPCMYQKFFLPIPCPSYLKQGEKNQRENTLKQYRCDPFCLCDRNKGWTEGPRDKEGSYGDFPH